MCARCKNIKLPKGECKQTEFRQGKSFIRLKNTLRVLLNFLEKVPH